MSFIPIKPKGKRRPQSWQQFKKKSILQKNGNCSCWGTLLSDRFWICSFLQVPCESHYHHFFICRRQTLSLLWIMSAIFHQTHAILLGDTLQQVFTSSIWCFTHLLELWYLKHIEFVQPTEVIKLDGWLSFKYAHSSWLDKCPFDTEWKFFSWEEFLQNTVLPVTIIVLPEL